ncbi:MAG: GNAT family N-acetyltransferase [Spirochaetales bacterium]|nr:GNAT family N-acetyltransferase [Spirochaetales bacterium]MCF7938246.1 GNAT family N-acetyltransferase [Spirochaetales bacterium]
MAPNNGNPSVHYMYSLPQTASPDDVVSLYLEAFGQKVSHHEIISKDRKKIEEVLRRSFVDGYAIYAVENGKMLGYLGYSTDGVTDTFDIRFSIFFDVFGFLGGLWKWLLYLLFGLFYKTYPGYFFIDSLAVRAEARGKRVGSQLIAEAENEAKRRGFDRLILQVVDTNTGARRLYERLGFVQVKRRYFGALTRPAGYEAADIMEKPFRENPFD